jgi:hypothetical protein
VPPSGLLRATVDGTVYETDRPTVLQVSTVISVSVGVPSYGLTAALLVNLNANNVVTGVFDCADLLSGTSVAISPSPKGRNMMESLAPMISRKSNPGDTAEGGASIASAPSTW